MQRRTFLIAALAAATAGCRRGSAPNVFVDPALATLVPADTTLLAGVRMQQLTQTAFFQRFGAKLKALEDFQRETGLDPRKDLWEFLLASNGKDAVVLIRGKFSEQGREPKLDRPGVQRFSHKGYTLLGDEQTAVVFLNPTTAAAGRTPTLRNLVDNRNNVTGIPKPIEQKIARIPSGNQVWFAGDAGGIVPERLEGNPMVKLFDSVQFATGYLDLGEKFKGTLLLECRSEQEAEKVRGAVAGLLGMGRLSTPDDEEDRGKTQQVFDGMNVFRESKVVRFSTDLTFDAITSSPFLAPLLGVK